MHPAVRYPVRVRARRTIPAARHPHVAATIPSLVPADPFISHTGRRRTTLHDRCRRTDTNHNLRKRGSRHQRNCEQKSQNNLLHETFSSCLVFRTTRQSRTGQLLPVRNNVKQEEIVALRCLEKIRAAHDRRRSCRANPCMNSPSVHLLGTSRFLIRRKVDGERPTSKIVLVGYCTIR